MTDSIKNSLEILYDTSQCGEGKNYIEVGVDEAGRGCLAGPVAAGAVIWPSDFKHDNIGIIDDSKKLSSKKRDIVRSYIQEHSLANSTCMIDSKVIDEVNIRQATFKAMHGAIDGALAKFFTSFPERKGAKIRIIVDGNDFKPYVRNKLVCGDCDPDGTCEEESMYIPSTTIVGGDRKYLSIAAASIMAKTDRDRLMVKLCEDNPFLDVYNWKSNMGYGAAVHKKGIVEHGITVYHRKTYAPCIGAKMVDLNGKQTQI